MIVDCAYYEHGVRQERQLTIEEAAAKPRQGGSYVWIELDDPSKDLMGEVSRHFGLHELAVEDAATAHQRPKVEPYDDFHFIVYRTARYDAEHRQVIFGELDLFLVREPHGPRLELGRIDTIELLLGVGQDVTAQDHVLRRGRQRAAARR